MCISGRAAFGRVRRCKKPTTTPVVPKAVRSYTTDYQPAAESRTSPEGMSEVWGRDDSGER